MGSDVAIRLEGISKIYRMYARPEDRLKQAIFRHKHYFREHAALTPSSLEIRRGETVGIVGRNGSGKSTMLQIICGTLRPSSGTLEAKGRISALLELGAGFNPEFSGRENIFLNAAILGLSREETQARYDDIVVFSGLPAEHLEQPVKTYSSGMYVRLAFAVAVAVEPDILVVDEALAVGDEAFQRKCYARLRDMQARGATILFVSHSAQAILELCSRAVLMDAGEILLVDSPKQVLTAYHRMIYAPGERQPAIRAAIRSGQWEEDGGAASVQEALAHEHYDPELTSESRVEYAQAGGEIRDLRIEKPDGTRINLLHTGEAYRIRYRLMLTDDAHRVKCGMLVKTLRGSDVAGAVNTSFAKSAETLQAGSAVEVQFDFRCNLRPGSYFLNSGATREIDGADIFIHRIVDALQFKVIDPQMHREKTLELVGTADLGITTEAALAL